MNIRMVGRLPFVNAKLSYKGREIELHDVLLDTGSAASVFSADELMDLGVKPEAEDILRKIIGVGGQEFVFSKRFDRVSLDNVSVNNLSVQVGRMEYGFKIQGIIGMDFLLQVGAIIDLDKLDFRAAPWN